MSETVQEGWAGSRGEKWRDHREGLEGTLEPVLEPLFEALALAGPARIAEVGCGAGGTALALARRAPEGSVVHGYDISAANVAEARGRVEQHPIEVRFEVADMGEAAPEAPYDRLLSRFGFMFFEDPEAGFQNLARWLAPGGRLAFATWGDPAENPWMLRVVGTVREMVELPEPDREGPGPFRYADPQRLLAELDAAGFHGLEVTTWRGRLPLGGGVPPSEAARFALAAFGSLGAALAEAGDAVVAEAHARVTEALAEHADDGVVRMPAAVHLVTGGR